MNLSHSIRVVTPTVDADVLQVLALADAAFTPPEVHRIIGEHSEDGVRRALGRLVRQGIVLSERAGRANLYRLNREHLAASAIVELANLRDTLLLRIGECVQRWKPTPILVALFGSAARGTMGVDSDIDLFVLRPNSVEEEGPKWREQVIALEQSVSRWTGNDARVLELNETEVEEGLHRENHLLQDIGDHGVVIFGSRSSLQRG